MGIFNTLWNTMQHSQLNKQKQNVTTLEERVAFLERELKITQQVLSNTLEELEKMTGQDLNGDGQLG